MGKRELLIIIGFVVVGAIVYQFTAPPPKPGERGFSLSRMFSGIRREISSHAASARLTKTGTIPVRAGISELRVSTARSVPLTIVGEAREDIGFEMPVESTGPDEATAREWANKTEVRQDDLGAALALSTHFPEEGTQNGTLTLRVPLRLAVRVENSGKIQVSNVAAVELRNIAGETGISGVSGALTGSHRSGDLTVSGAGSVNLTLVSSRAKIRNVTRGVTLNARNGECAIADSPGHIEATLSGVELVINAMKNTIKISGDGGQVRVLDAHDLTIDGRRMLVDVEATPEAGDRLTIITSDERLQLLLAGTPSLVLDAATTNGGSIRAADFGVEPSIEGREARLNKTLGDGGARFVLRNSRGDIVIGRRK